MVCWHLSPLGLQVGGAAELAGVVLLPWLLAAPRPAAAGAFVLPAHDTAGMQLQV